MFYQISFKLSQTTNGIAFRIKKLINWSQKHAKRIMKSIRKLEKWNKSSLYSFKKALHLYP